MTTTIATQPQYTTVIDASTVQIENNIRTEADLDEPFLATISELGILTPVLARRTTDGVLHVRIGQRRTLAAQKLGVPLPVIFYDDLPDAPEPKWLRSAIQFVENDHRSPITTGQRVAGYRQMELDGLSMTKIADITGQPKDQVKAGLKVAKSEKATAVAAEFEIDLLQLAVIAEFEDDADTVLALTQTAVEEPYQFDHTVSYYRRERAKALARKERRAMLEENNIPTLDPDLLTNGEAVRLAELERDESIEVDPDLGDGIYIVVQSRYGDELMETKVVLDPAKYGYKPRTYSSGQSNTGKRTPEQLAERRRVIACNKAWDAAEPVRADWLAAFIGRKSIPKDAAVFIAVMLTRHAYAINSNSTAIAHELLGIEQKHGYGVDAIADYVEEHPTKAGVAMLAVVLSKLESGTSRDTWRQAQAHSRAYLQQLRDWGYELAPVERIALGELTDLPEMTNLVEDFDEEYSEEEEEDGTE